MPEQSTSPSLPFGGEDARVRLLAGGFIILALVLVAYLPILPGSFLMDDRRLVETDNPLVNGTLTPFSIWFQTDFALSTFLFWLQWLAWGSHPGWYHLVNILLHALGAVMLWRILVRLEIPGAWVAGALFAVHPVCVNSVARIAELKNTLSLPFFLLSFWLYLPNLGFAKTNPESSNRAALRYGLSLLAFVLALMSKTSTVMLPFVFLAVALWHNDRLTRNDFLRASPFFVVALAFGLMSTWFQKHQAMTGPPLPPESVWLRLTTAGRIFWFYLGKALLPLRLNLVYPQWKSDGVSPVSFLPLFFIFGVIFVCWRVRRGWGQHILLALGVFGITLFPALGFFDSQFLTKWRVSDHLQYLPLIAPVSLVAGALGSLLPIAYFRGVAAVIVLSLSLLTYQRARVFSSEENLFRDTLAKNPAAWGIQNDLGVWLAAREKYPEAEEHLRAALQIKPDYADAYSNLGHLMAIEGKFGDAEKDFLAALKIDPNDSETHRRYAMILMQQRRISEALAHIRIALELSPKPEIRTRLQYASILHQTGNLRGAVAELRKVIQLQPNSVEGLNNLAWLLATASDDKVRNGAEAVQLAEKASHLPSVTNLCVPGTLAAAYAEAGRFPEAVATAEAAVKWETAAGDARFAAMNQQLLQYYREGKPFHEPPPRNQ